jgi:hypothetical protein
LSLIWHAAFTVCYYHLSVSTYGGLWLWQNVSPIKIDSHSELLRRQKFLMSLPMHIHQLILWIASDSSTICGPGSSVGIVTDYRLDSLGMEPRWGPDFPPVQTSPRAHPASCTMGARSFLGVKCDWGVQLTTHPLLAPRSSKSRAIPLPPSGPQPGL